MLLSIWVCAERRVRRYDSSLYLVTAAGHPTTALLEMAARAAVPTASSPALVPFTQVS